MRTIEMCCYLWRRLHDWVMRVLQPSPAPMVTTPTDRRELFEQLAALRATRAAEAEQHQQSVEALTRDLLPAQATVETLRRALADLQAGQFCASIQAGAEEDRLLRQVTAKSSMSVHLFIEEMDHELSVLHRTEATVLPSAHRDYVIGKKTMGLETDGPSRKRRAAALNAARARAVAMQGELLTVEQMNGELIRLRRTIPGVANEVIHTERASIVAYN